MQDILTAWITAWPNSRGKDSDLVTISMRFDITDHVLTIIQEEYITSRTKPTKQKHVSLGLIDAKSLVVLRDAINLYLHKIGEQ